MLAPGGTGDQQDGGASGYRLRRIAREALLDHEAVSGKQPAGFRLEHGPGELWRALGKIGSNFREGGAADRDASAPGQQAGHTEQFDLVPGAGGCRLWFRGSGGAPDGGRRWLRHALMIAASHAAHGGVRTLRDRATGATGRAPLDEPAAQVEVAGGAHGQGQHQDEHDKAQDEIDERDVWQG